MYGADELAGIASGEVGAAYGSGEEGVSGQEEGVVGEVEAGAALRVAGGVEDLPAKACDRYGLAVFEAGVGGVDFRGGGA